MPDEIMRFAGQDHGPDIDIAGFELLREVDGFANIDIHVLIATEEEDRRPPAIDRAKR